MAKLSDAMIKGLRHFADAGTAGRLAPAGTGRTVSALKSRWLIADTPRGYRLTTSGRNVLAEIDRVEREAAYQTERLSRPVPADAFVEPGASKPVADFPEYEDEPADDFAEQIKRATGLPAVEAKRITREEFDRATGSGPSVRLSPPAEDAKDHASDVEVLQLLALLDAGAKVTRVLFRNWTVEKPGPFTLDPARLDHAANAAVWQRLATSSFRRADGFYTLVAEPIHYVTNPGAKVEVTACGRFLAAPVGKEMRYRYTSDPAKVTHGKCRTS